jgi:site-specific DNA-methyltransferase (adenine-specific)
MASEEVTTALLNFLDRDTRRGGEKAKTDIRALVGTHAAAFLPKHAALLESTFDNTDYGFTDKNWTSLFKAIEIVLCETSDYKQGKKPMLRKKRKAPELVAPAVTAPTGFAPLPREKYNLIYCDPPWQYKVEKGVEGVAARHYKTVSNAELCKLNVPSICEANSVIIMWATWPKIQEALQVMGSWGFEYVTALMVWLKLEKSGKPRLNIGWWLRSNTEFILVGKRGKVTHLKNLDFMCRTSQVMETSDGVEYEFAPEVPVLETVGRGVHSRKPEEARRIIEAAFPDANKIELFARGEIPGWATWGNQTEASPELEAELKKTDKQHAVSDKRIKELHEYYNSPGARPAQV